MSSTKASLRKRITPTLIAAPLSHQPLALPSASPGLIGGCASERLGANLRATGFEVNLSEERSKVDWKKVL